MAFLSHYRAGEIVSGESISFAGLVGGLHQVNSTWSLMWGRIPLADRRLVVIDEISGMSYDDIGAMSSMRSSGIAEVTKIRQERTNARTRMIWLSNVRRQGARLKDYPHGVLAVKELIGRLEDVSRFDLFLTLSSEEVSIDDINKARPVSTDKLKYSSNDCHDLLMWAWSRKPENVVFSKGVEALILELSSAQGKLYSPSIPLVEPAEHRDKIATI